MNITEDGVTAENSSSLAGNPAVTIGGDDVTFVNKAGGTVAGHPAILITGSGARIVNEAGGLIRGEGGGYWWESEAIRGSQFADIIVNYGRLQGEINLGGGNDRYEYYVSTANSDTSGASIYLGDGDDEAIYHTDRVASLRGVTIFGNAGYDTLTFDGIADLRLPNSWVGFERAVFIGLGVSSVSIDDFDAFQEFVLSPGLTLSLTRSGDPYASTNALVRLEGGNVIVGGSSTLRAISGTDAAETAYIEGLVTGNVDMGGGNDFVELEGTILGAVALGAGDDLFDITGTSRGRYFLRPGSVGGPVDGGSGIDRIVLFDMTGRTFDFSHFTNFEQIEINGPPGSDVRLTHLDGIQSLRVHVNPGTRIAVGETLAPSLWLPYSYGTEIVIESTATLGGIGAASGPSDDWHSGNSAVLRIDGTISGDVNLLSTNDHFDARLGSIAGIVSGGGGNDTILMGAGADRVDGGGGDDVVDGGAGADNLAGNRGRDELHGGDGGDSLSGGFDDDRLYGGDGDDFLRETQGVGDWLIGGAGNDVIELDRLAYSYDPPGSHLVDGGSGDDRILIATGGDNRSHVDLDAGEGADHITLGYIAGSANIRLGAGADKIVMDMFLDGWRGDILLLDFAAGDGGDSIDIGDREYGDLRLIQRGTDTWLMFSWDMSSWSSKPLVIFADTDATSFTAANFGGHSLTVLSPPVTVHEGTSGADSFQATGDDLYFINHNGDYVWEPDSSTYDEVRSGLAQLVLPESIERLVLTGTAQQVTGSWSNSVVTATDGDDVLLFGQRGRDRIAAGGGDDLIYFGAYFTPADIVDGGAGRDRLVLRGSYVAEAPLQLGLIEGIEELVFLSSADIEFEPSNATRFSYVVATIDRLVPANGLLEVDASSLREDETLTFDGSGEQDGRFDLTGGAGADVLRGGLGNDVIDGGAGTDTIRGGDGGDSLSGGDGDDSIEGGDGTDVLLGASGNDSIRGGGGGDSLSGGEGDDAMEGGDGSDVLLGDSGNDTIDAGGGDDVADGGAGNDSITGGAGGDLVQSGDGKDILSGGDGDDRLYFGAHFTSVDMADGGAGHDRLILRGHYSGGTALMLVSAPGIEEIVFLSSADTQFGPDAGTPFSYVVETIHGLAPFDGMLEVDASSLRAGESLNFDGWREGRSRFHLTGGAGADSLGGGGGDDFIDGGSGADTMLGRHGDDIYVVDNGGDILIEYSGTDLVRTALATYTLGADIENLTAISDTSHDFRGNIANNVVTGGGGADFLRLQDGGDDTAIGGGGNDGFLFGGALTRTDIVDGGDGKDELTLQGDYSSGLTLGAVTSVEVMVLLPGNDIRFGAPGTQLYSYSITTADQNVAAGVLMNVDGNRLRAGENLVFDGSAETDGAFYVFAGKGVDRLTGGAKNDAFLFRGPGNFTGADTVHGGAGFDELALRGDYTGANKVVFGVTTISGIEAIVVVSGHDLRYGKLAGDYSFDLTMHEASVASGQVMIVDAGTLRGGERLVFDGSAETDGGRFTMFGGKGNDVLTGGSAADSIRGGLGADVMKGNAGADTFVYRDSAESTTGAADQILDVLSGTDRIDLTKIDANTLVGGDQAFTWIGSNAFSGSGAAGQLRAYQDGANWFVEGDTNGDGAADLVIQVAGGPIAQGDFLP